MADAPYLGEKLAAQAPGWLRHANLGCPLLQVGLLQRLLPECHGRPARPAGPVLSTWGGDSANGWVLPVCTDACCTPLPTSSAVQPNPWRAVEPSPRATAARGQVSIVGRLQQLRRGMQVRRERVFNHSSRSPCRATLALLDTSGPAPPPAPWPSLWRAGARRQALPLAFAPSLYIACILVYTAQAPCAAAFARHGAAAQRAAQRWWRPSLDGVRLVAIFVCTPRRRPPNHVAVVTWPQASKRSTAANGDGPPGLAPCAGLPRRCAGAF